MSSESREGGIKIGKRYLKMINTLYPQSGLQDYARWIDHNFCYGNSSIIHGWIIAYLEVEADVSVFTHLYVSVNNLLQSALRLTFVGPNGCTTGFAKTLSLCLAEEAAKIIDSCPKEDGLFSYSIIQEIEAMRHETLYSRLFMS